MAATGGPEIRNLIFGYTTGTISRHDTIQVQFSADMVPRKRVGTTLSPSPLRFDPPVRGKAAWTNPRRLGFEPADPLAPGQIYAVTLDLAAISAQPDAGVFGFDFDVMERDFDIRIDGFNSGDRRKRLILTGILQTADRESGRDVESTVKARQEGRDLKIRWKHGDRGQRHQFTIVGIRRKQGPSRVAVHWDGRSIGVGRAGDKKLAVLPMGPFRVLGVQATADLTRYVEIRFSDPLAGEQDLTGMIRLGSGMDASHIEVLGDRIRIFADSRPAGRVAVTVDAGVRNAYGKKLGATTEHEVSFGALKPGVRFVGHRVIVPTIRGLTLPFETANLRAVVVEVVRVPESNMPQFLQVNRLDKGRELERVGTTVLRRVVPLQFQDDQENRWVRHGLDVRDLVGAASGSAYRLNISFLPHHTAQDCEGLRDAPITAEDISEENWSEMIRRSFRNNWEGYEETPWRDMYRNRHDPCHPGYYLVHGRPDRISDSRNILVSNIGLIAKQGTGNQVHVAVTDIASARPQPGVSLEMLDYQQQVLATAVSDRSGMAVMSTAGKPFLLIARREVNGTTHFGYLRIVNGNALSVSHFDVAGRQVKDGLGGFIYGERGVWRPGDPIHLTYILQDDGGQLPDDHPVVFELYNPRGQREVREVSTEGLNGFYTFQARTTHDAPTGDWLARVKIGGAVFEKKLKVEAIKPNRLKIQLSFGEKTRSLASGRLDGELEAQWLHGGTARNLEADIRFHLTERKTAFPGYGEYSFDDPVRVYETERHTLFDDTLNEKGSAKFSVPVVVENTSPGMLTAHFETRVFEPGGDFSIDRSSMPFHPYRRYVGVSTPPGDDRGMLQTDQVHTVRLVLLDTDGRPVPAGEVEVVLYKIRWRWWWEREREEFADFSSSDAYRVVERERISIDDGKGEWTFRIRHPGWGRYLVRASDAGGRHYAGRVLYVDWPGWSRRGTKDTPGAATVLAFSSDKPEYEVNDTVTVTIPVGDAGRGLVSIEDGSRVLRTDWVQGSGEAIRYAFTATRDMVPNVYFHVTHLQPHLQAANDRPIRMYGVIPVRVTDAATVLEPVIDVPESFSPESAATVSVSEETGRAMTYTLALVDEGLLDLTRFATPDPWQHFFKREALGVRTWDVFDLVAGAYGGVLEQLLAIGGGGEGGEEGSKKASRFPPMVRFLGPFALSPGQTGEHRIDIPLYVGSVRTMVVAGQGGAYGAADTSVPVRKPLMVLGTLPRVMGTGEAVDLPVSVFAMVPSVTDVSVNVAAEGALQVVGARDRQITFDEPGDQLVAFALRADDRPGVGRIIVAADGDGDTARHEIEIDVRVPSAPVTRDVSGIIKRGRSWRQTAVLPGLAGTNTVVLEVSRIPPLNLESRLGFLMRYPHGCVEQVTSSVFPQLYLDRLMDLDLEKRTEVQSNIRAGIRRLRKFQMSGGGFSYWSGDGLANDWSTSYAGHFLVEAARHGYRVPADMLAGWKRHQRRVAGEWDGSSGRAELSQAYRLYTLALGGSPDLGAMNRLREAADLALAARWRLAAAYQLAGQPEAATDLTSAAGTGVAKYRELSGTFGSDLRDEAMTLEALYLMGRTVEAVPLIQAISSALSSELWMSTQTTAFALLAMARAAGDVDLGSGGDMRFSYSWRGEPKAHVTSAKPMVRYELDPGDGAEGVIAIDNTGDGLLYARLILTGLPEPGRETASSNGIELAVEYTTLDGEAIDVSRLEQGTDLLASVTVDNNSAHRLLKEVALSQLFPSGWEIRNARLSGEIHNEDRYTYRDVRDDRVYTYFNIYSIGPKTFTIQLTAAYRGRYYLPVLSAEAMYDATISGRIPGQWVEVVGEEEQRQ